MITTLFVLIFLPFFYSLHTPLLNHHYPVSVIVLIHTSEHLISTLDTLIKQTALLPCKPQIICVVDGMDNSIMICKAYQRRYSEIVVAEELSITSITGNYIVCVDIHEKLDRLAIQNWSRFLECESTHFLSTDYYRKIHTLDYRSGNHLCFYHRESLFQSIQNLNHLNSSYNSCIMKMVQFVTSSPMLNE